MNTNDTTYRKFLFDTISLQSPEINKSIKDMRKTIVCIAALIFFSCNTDKSKEDPGEKLSAAMIDFLYKRVEYDSSKVKYYAEKVIYFEEAKYYNCEFKIRMTLQNEKDTLGTMRAFISKDFKEVKRTY